MKTEKQATEKQTASKHVLTDAQLKTVDGASSASVCRRRKAHHRRNAGATKDPRRRKPPRVFYRRPARCVMIGAFA